VLNRIDAYKIKDDFNISSVTLLEFLQVHDKSELSLPVQLYLAIEPHRFSTRYSAFQNAIHLQVENERKESMIGPTSAESGSNTVADVGGLQLQEEDAGEEEEEEEYEEYEEYEDEGEEHAHDDVNGEQQGIFRLPTCANGCSGSGAGKIETKQETNEAQPEKVEEGASTNQVPEAKSGEDHALGMYRVLVKSRWFTDDFRTRIQR
jgi:hypothetical protein